ncbi:Balanoglossus misakiensis BmHox4 mRNA for transcription factor Hox4, partial [Biomphalaria glabrata]
MTSSILVVNARPIEYLQLAAFFLPFHSPILKPDLDLPLCQCQTVGDFDPTPPGQVSIEVKFFFQLQCLVSR